MATEHEYKGVTIWLDKGIPSGYHGRWKVGSRHGFATLAQAKAYVDEVSAAGKIRNGRICDKAS